MKTEKYCILENATVKDAIAQMEKAGIKALLVVDDSMVMQGLFTLGDMRSFFLHGGKLSDGIVSAMNTTPHVFSSIYEAENYEIKMVIYPIIDENGRVIDVIDDKEPVAIDVLQDVPVVIMAGGKGTRLKPYTNVLPKALIPIGDVTITERIIESFSKYGCHDFYMILNHKAGMIKSYFQDLDKNYSMQFEEETIFLGTGGGLFFLKDRIDKTFFLSNCDILIRADLECAYRVHKKNNNLITTVAAMKNIVLPYGVIEADEFGYVTGLKEKPELSYLTNTGVYIIEPCVLNMLQKNEKIHMTEIIQRLIKQGEKVGVFPISEKSWLDMGQINQLEEMYKTLKIQ